MRIAGLSFWRMARKVIQSLCGGTHRTSSPTRCGITPSLHCTSLPLSLALRFIHSVAKPRFRTLHFFFKKKQRGSPAQTYQPHRQPPLRAWSGLIMYPKHFLRASSPALAQKIAWSASRSHSLCGLLL